MTPAAALLATTVLASPSASTSASSSLPSGAGTIAVALVGGLSLVVVALIPELFRLLRRDPAAVPPEVATPHALELLEQRLRTEIETRVAAVRASTVTNRAEVRALRGALERRDEEHRDRMTDLRDELHRHLWRDHGGPVPAPLPVPREPEPA